jgi:secreted trypsin-like serine protease
VARTLLASERRGEGRSQRRPADRDVLLDRGRFDAWTKTLAARAGSRRSFVGLLAGGAGWTFGSSRRDETLARKRSRKRPRRDRLQRGLSKQIIGGRDVPDGTYPFVAALLDVTRGSSAFVQQFCGGALIAPNYVLTAAHCLEDFAADPSDLRVVVGRTRLNSTAGVVRGVSRVALHPAYNPYTASHDAALLELSSPIAELPPIALAQPGDESLEQPGVRLKVIGWGDTVPQPNSSNAFPDRLQEVDIPVRSDQTCADSFAEYDGSIMVCAGEPGRDSCFGDSGGPLFGTVDGVRRLVGIVSFGAGCGGDTPGAYTEVNAESIASFIAQHSPSPSPSPSPPSPRQQPRKHKRKRRKNKHRNEKGKHGH